MLNNKEKLDEVNIEKNSKRKNVLRNMFIVTGCIVALGILLSGLAWGGYIPSSL